MYRPIVIEVLFEVSIKLRSPVSNSFFVHGVTSPLPVVSTTFKVSESLNALNTLTTNHITNTSAKYLYKSFITHVYGS